MLFHYLSQSRSVLKREFDKPHPAVIRETSRTASANSRPHLQPSLHRLFDNKSANKTAGAGNKNFHFAKIIKKNYIPPLILNLQILAHLLTNIAAISLNNETLEQIIEHLLTNTAAISLNNETTEQNIETTLQIIKTTEQNIETTLQIIKTTEQNIETTEQHIEMTEQNIKTILQNIETTELNNKSIIPESQSTIIATAKKSRSQ
jgi:predicted RND superfamily exporter protein